MILKSLLPIVCIVFCVQCSTEEKPSPDRPNILFCISDDQSFPHAGAYGTKWVNTPAFDRVAREGILFTNAYTPNAKCAPSRSCILTGRNSWQLEEAANHVPYFPAKFKTYAEVLKEAGYLTGYTGKGWAPGDPGQVDGGKRLLLGEAYSEVKLTPPTKAISSVDYAANFKSFFESKGADQPFCFWYGATEPHRRYEYGTGISRGNKSKDQIESVFDFWPDNDTVRTDLLDYAYEIEHFDDHLGQILAYLEEVGELDNTLVIVTSDNGMPFPRLKGQSYEYSNHLPLAMMWPKGIKNSGRKFEKFVSFTDYAPTILDAAGINFGSSGMADFEGTSLLPVFGEETYDDEREFMVIGKERHDLGRPDDWGYPMRGIIDDGFLYLKNYKSDRWPAGHPETGYMNCDGSPTKTYIINQNRRKEGSEYWDLNFGKRPGEELYMISEDPDCMDNLIEDPAYGEVLSGLKSMMESELKKEGDPRINGNGDIFDNYEYSQDATRNFYNRFMAGEDIKAGWINQSDIEPKGFVEEFRRSHGE
ncbi:sulfatase family protein [Membranihabitans maritimus]|uniref:sulfatase family protein n=1 Tax=Membranihabitans maritimus TaxID=2904244 RepID=UPI001F27DEC7|nr:sulfatase [Membranihabitans maritimus]